MNIKLTLSFIFFIYSLKVNSQFTQVFTHNSSNDNIRSLHATSDGGVIAMRLYDYLRSSDGGTNWTINPQTSIGCANSTWDLNSVALYNKDTFLFACNNDSYSYFSTASTTNSGSNFTCNTYTNSWSNDGLNRAYYGTNGRVFIGTKDGDLFYSDDFGVNFNFIQNVLSSKMISFLDNDKGIIVQANDAYYYDHSTGIMSNLIVPAINEDISSFVAGQLVGPTTIFLLRNGPSGGSNLYKSTNGGNYWQKVFETDLTGINFISNIQFINADTGFVYGSKILLKTEDGGNTWKVKRFSALNLEQIWFTDVNTGYIAGTKSSASYIYKTTNGGGNYADFNQYYFDYSACCAGALCTVYNTGSVSSNYTWVLDGNVIGSGYTPPALSLTSGNHTLALISDDGIEIDTFSQTIYSAPALPGSININGNPDPDTTLCYGSVFHMPVGSSSTSYLYSMWEDTNLLYGPFSGNASTLHLYSPELTDSAVITIRLESQYNFCPGNTINKDFNVLVYPNTAVDNPFFADDSVCRGDTAIFTILNSNSNYSYEIKSDPIPGICSGFSEATNGNNQQLNHPIPIGMHNNTCSNIYYYTVSDSYGCIYDSEKTKLFVDSINARLYTHAAYGYVGDTISFNNKSEGTEMAWLYDHSYLEMIDSNWNASRFKMLTDGNSKVSLMLANETGCHDTAYQFIHSFDSTIAYSNLCLTMKSTDDPTTVFYPTSCEGFHNYFKVLHVDKVGNSYLAGLDEVLDNGYNFSISTLSKIDSSGVVLWKRELDLGGASVDKSIFITSIATDSMLNIYFTGRYNDGTFTIDGITFPHITGSDPGSGFIAKLNPDGDFQWIDFSNIVSSTAQSNFVSNIKVLNSNTIVAFANNINLIQQRPLAQTIWINPSPVLEYGFLFIDSMGMVKNFQGYNSLYENFFSDIGCSQIVFPYGMDYEIIDDRIYMVSLMHFFSAPSTYFHGTNYFATGLSESNETFCVVSVFDTSGNLIRDFETFRFTDDYNRLFDYTDAGYLSDDVDWDYGGRYSTEPSLAVDGRKNIYVSFTPNALKSYTTDTDSISRSISGFYFQNEGFIEGTYRSSLLMKLDTLGNEIYRLFNNGVVVKDICISEGGDVNGIADYTGYYQLNSVNGNHHGHSSGKNTISGLFFTYDKNGNLRNTSSILSDANVTTAAISAIDTCNSNVYFAYVAGDTASYQGEIMKDDFKYFVVKVNNDNDCFSTSVCPWLPEQVIVNSMDEIEVFTDWRLSPNPSNDKIKVSYMGNIENLSNVSFIVYNSIGQMVSTENNLNAEKIELDIRNYQNGIYYLCLSDVDGNYLEKLSFVKQ